MLGRIWEKDMVGVNKDCQISHMKIEEVIKFLREQEPKDILCLGSRTNGDMGSRPEYPGNGISTEIQQEYRVCEYPGC